MYSKGTDLRSQDGKSYQWPHPMFGPCEPTQYDGLTTIIRSWGEGNDFASATWTAQEALRLHNAAELGESVYRFSGCVPIGNRFENTHELVKASELIQDSEYLRKFHFSELGRCADRGTVLHELLHYYAHPDAFPLSDADIPHWVDERISEGDGSRAYRCDADETTGHCVQLNRWLTEHQPEILLSEVAGFHDELGYACTLDALMKLGGSLYIVDAKSRGASKMHDALQLIAQKNVQHLAVTGENRRIASESVGFPLAKCASLLVSPDKATFRVLQREDEAWSLFTTILSAYRVQKAHGLESLKGVFGTVKEFDQQETLAI